MDAVELSQAVIKHANIEGIGFQQFQGFPGVDDVMNDGPGFHIPLDHQVFDKEGVIFVVFHQ
jgi:hypothetical protein